MRTIALIPPKGGSFAIQAKSNHLLSDDLKNHFSTEKKNGGVSCLA